MPLPHVGSPLGIFRHFLLETSPLLEIKSILHWIEGAILALQISEFLTDASDAQMIKWVLFRQNHLYHNYEYREVSVLEIVLYASQYLCSCDSPLRHTYLLSVSQGYNVE